ncbi:putative C6 transcription factor [Talaromyces proteolyticus]|uniref:C6 transcription factor n=1 Tax=Talaromyces proteolyticus TaxID=1131652 RepID=A0AAD4KZ26_9EURO|nr:putative C6 transcription factor [Talaromyces proteolyticus]KAH8704171.1 putative C6 transcription factor [Talaromyces proteolyticus]
MTEVLRSIGQHEPRQTNHVNSPLRQSGLTSTATRKISYDQTLIPSWDRVLDIARSYLVYCDCQPLPLFHRQTFLRTLDERDPEIIYSILALALRYFSNPPLNDFDDIPTAAASYTEAARGLVTRRVLGGPVEISTLQSLCLLSIIEFTNGNIHQATIHSGLALDLARCANLALDPVSIQDDVAKEERRRCFWSICLLRRLHGEEVHILDFTSQDCLPRYPKSTGEAPNIDGLDPSGIEARIVRRMKDEGIVSYVLLLSETFSRTAAYVKRRGKPNNFPPWSPESEYSKIIALQMDGETRMPYTHRFKYANLDERTLEDLQSNRDYWGPWFLNQFMYHTILCLLNHPLLLSLVLRNHKSVIPEIFLQHSSDMLASHTTWILHFVRYFAEKGFKVSDPFLGYCVAVVATIELQLSFTEDAAIRKNKQERFKTCTNFVRDLGKEWPHMAKMAEKLEALNGAVEASYVPYAQAQNKTLLIDLSRFWEILDYSSSVSDTTNSLFGPSLYLGSTTRVPEVSNTSPLPQPTRIGSSHSTPRQTPRNSNFMAQNVSQNMDTGLLTTPVDPYDDQFSMLAENFFTQGQDFIRNPEDWFSTGNL